MKVTVYELDIGGMTESNNAPKEQAKSHYVNGEYDLFSFIALLLHCPQNTSPPCNKIATARRQGLKTKVFP